MEVRAIAKAQRISPRKLRLVAEAVKHMSIDQAYATLEITDKKAALIMQKTLKSAVANAITNAKLEKDQLLIASVMVNEAPPFKRFRPSTRGRIHPYKKRGSHLTIILKEKPAVKVQADTKALVAKDTKKEKKEVAKAK